MVKRSNIKHDERGGKGDTRLSSLGGKCLPTARQVMGEETTIQGESRTPGARNHIFRPTI